MLKALPRPVALAGAKGSLPRQHLSVAVGQGPFSTGSYYEPVLKGPLTPGHKKAEVFSHFGHRSMPHCVVFMAQYRDSAEYYYWEKN